MLKQLTQAGTNLLFNETQAPAWRAAQLCSLHQLLQYSMWTPPLLLHISFKSRTYPPFSLWAALPKQFLYGCYLLLPPHYSMCSLSLPPSFLGGSLSVSRLLFQHHRNSKTAMMADPRLAPTDVCSANSLSAGVRDCVKHQSLSWRRAPAETLSRVHPKDRGFQAFPFHRSNVDIVASLYLQRTMNNVHFSVL